MSSLGAPAVWEPLTLSEVKVVKVTQPCPTLGDPVDYTVHGILQARTLEQVAFPFSRGFSQPRDWTQVSRIVGRFFTSWATKEAQTTGGSIQFRQPGSCIIEETWNSCRWNWEALSFCAEVHFAKNQLINWISKWWILLMWVTFCLCCGALVYDRSSMNIGWRTKQT